jgi:hypothetical protein
MSNKSDMIHSFIFTDAVCGFGVFMSSAWLRFCQSMLRQRSPFAGHLHQGVDPSFVESAGSISFDEAL